MKRSLEEELLRLARAVAAGKLAEDRGRDRAARLGGRERFEELLESARCESDSTLVLGEGEIPISGKTERRRIGRHEIEKELGRGAMGVVYKAREVLLDRTVALKVLISGRDADPESIARFLREARTAASVRHHNLVEIYEVGQDGDLFYYSMEYVAGETLAHRLSAGPLGAEQAARIVRDASRGLAAAHLAGIVHRDVKPSNLLLDESDRVLVTDFGLGKSLAGGNDLTRSGVVMGTPVFMPPEQARGDGREIGPASDVYSLAATLYTALTGRFPFDGERPTLDLLAAIQREEPPRPSSIVPRIPVDLETIVLVGLEKDPRRRYADAGALADDLDRFLAREPILARPPGRLRRLGLWVRRRPASAAVLAALLVALGAGGVAAARRIAREARLGSAIAAGDRALDAGELEAALAGYEAAMALDAGDQDARRRREHAAFALVEAGMEDLRRDDPAGAARRLERLDALLEPTPTEAAQARRLAGAIDRDQLWREAVEGDLASVGAVFDNDSLRESIRRIGDLLVRCERGDRDPEYLRRVVDRAAEGAHRLVRRSLIYHDAVALQRIVADLLPKLGLDASDEWGGVRTAVSIEAESDDWRGNRVPLPDARLDVHLHELLRREWSGDQEPDVQALLGGPGRGARFESPPGRYLLVVRSEGHFGVRTFLDLYPATRLRVRLRLYREQDVGLPVVAVASPRIEIEDALVETIAGSPRARWIDWLNSDYRELAGTSDSFAAVDELSGTELARIVPRQPRAGWCPLGWRREPWGPMEGEATRPVRGITRAQAAWIAREASRILLPPDLAGAWRFDLPETSPMHPATSLRCWTPPQDPWGALYRLPMGARPVSEAGAGNVGSGEVADVGRDPLDLSLHGCRDLEGNVSEWLARPSGAGLQAMGENFEFSRSQFNDASRLGPEEWRSYVGLRLVLVPGPAGGGAAVEPTGDPEADDRRAREIFEGSGPGGGDALTALALLESSLAVHGDHVPSRLDATLIALAQHNGPRARDHAAAVIAMPGAHPEAVRFARFLRVWSIFNEFAESDEPDWATGLGDLDALLASDPEGPLWLLFRAVFRVLAGKLPEGLLDLSAVVPRVERFLRVEPWFGLDDAESARDSGDASSDMSRFFRDRFLASGDVPRAPDAIAFDAEYLDRGRLTSRAHLGKVAARWQGILTGLLDARSQRRMVEVLGRPGEEAPEVLARVVDLLARTLALLTLETEARAVTQIGPLIARGLDVDRVLADVGLAGGDVGAAASRYAKALQVRPGDARSLLGLAWCRIVEAGRAADAHPLLEEATVLCERAATAGEAEAEVYRVFIDLEAGRLDEARRRLEGIVAARPGDALAWALTGEVARRSGDAPAASAAWDRAIGADRLARPLVEHLRREH